MSLFFGSIERVVVDRAPPRISSYHVGRSINCVVIAFLWTEHFAFENREKQKHIRDREYDYIERSSPHSHAIAHYYHFVCFFFFWWFVAIKRDDDGEWKRIFSFVVCLFRWFVIFLKIGQKRLTQFIYTIYSTLLLNCCRWVLFVFQNKQTNNSSVMRKTEKCRQKSIFGESSHFEFHESTVQ